MPFMRKQILITEVIGVKAQDGGESPGQILDRMLGEAAAKGEAVHEVTFGFEDSADWADFARALDTNTGPQLTARK